MSNEVLTLRAGPELDEAVIREILKFEIVDDAQRIGEALLNGDVPLVFRLADGGFSHTDWRGRFAPSADMAAAWVVAEALSTRRRTVSVSTTIRGTRIAAVNDFDEHGRFVRCVGSAEAATGAHAICLVGLQASASDSLVGTPQGETT